MEEKDLIDKFHFIQTLKDGLATEQPIISKTP